MRRGRGQELELSSTLFLKNAENWHFYDSTRSLKIYFQSIENTFKSTECFPPNFTIQMYGKIYLQRPFIHIFIVHALKSSIRAIHNGTHRQQIDVHVTHPRYSFIANIFDTTFQICYVPDHDSFVAKVVIIEIWPSWRMITVIFLT